MWGEPGSGLRTSGFSIFQGWLVVQLQDSACLRCVAGPNSLRLYEGLVSYRDAALRRATVVLEHVGHGKAHSVTNGAWNKSTDFLPKAQMSP